MEINGNFLHENFLPYFCKICETNCHKKSVYEKHLVTPKHLRKSNLHENFLPIKCKICDIDFANKQNFVKHLLTSKHLRKSKMHENILPTSEIFQHAKSCVNNLQNNEHQHDNIISHDFFLPEEKFNCNYCNKEYNTNSGLWKHMQKCKSSANEIQVQNKKQIQNQLMNKMNKEIITPELFMLLIQQNKEMQQMMMEQQKYFAEQQKQQNTIIEKVIENGGNHNSNNTINNDNKSFNLNFFLNETCKNAMNLSDFVNGVNISLDDFEETGRIGYVEGLSRIFCKELRKLAISERPIHCSDAKRETIYIRENNRWEKDENKEKLLRAVKQIGKKNIKVLTLWQEKYPGYKDVESKENDRYLHILTNIMCGETEEEIQSNYGKIMKNISRITVVDKNR
jgi:hypothetical protein